MSVENENESVAGGVDAAKEFKSRLSTGRTRFLSHAVENALTSGRRSAADFIRLFPPSKIMEALDSKPQLRARILVDTTGTREKVALQKSPASAGEDLQIALDVGETDEAAIVALFRPDDRVRYLDAKELWAFVSEGEFWKQDLDVMALEIGRSHVGFVVDKAMEEKLLKACDVIDGITVDRLAQVLPREELGWMLAKALERGRGRKPFTDEQFLAEAPIGVLADHVPLSELWERVVIDHIAKPLNLVEPVEPVETTEKAAGEAPASVAPVAAAADRESAAPAPIKAEPTVSVLSSSVAPPPAGVVTADVSDAEDAETSKKSGGKTGRKKSKAKADADVGAAMAAPRDDYAGLAKPPGAEAPPFDFSDVTASEEIEEAVVAAAIKASTK